MSEKYRVVWDYDFDPHFSYLEQWNTPEKYEESPMYKGGEKISFEEYIKTWGNPERHVELSCTIQSRCDCCGAWNDVDTLYGIDFMDWQDYDLGTYTPEEALELRNEHQAEVAKDMLP